MKSNILALIGAAVGITSVGLITYKLLNRRESRHTSGSLKDLYLDNKISLDKDKKGGDLN